MFLLQYVEVFRTLITLGPVVKAFLCSALILRLSQEGHLLIATYAWPGENMSFNDTVVCFVVCFGTVPNNRLLHFANTYRGIGRLLLSLFLKRQLFWLKVNIR